MMEEEILKQMMVGNTYAMLVEGQFMDFDFEALELKKIGREYLYFEYLADDNWLHKKGCQVKYKIKSSCAWVENHDYKEECYVKDTNGRLGCGYKVCRQMKGRCFMSAVLIGEGKILAGDKSIFAY